MFGSPPDLPVFFGHGEVRGDPFHDPHVPLDTAVENTAVLAMATQTVSDGRPLVPNDCARWQQ